MNITKVYCPNCGKELGEFYPHVLCSQHPMAADSSGKKAFSVMIIVLNNIKNNFK